MRGRGDLGFGIVGMLVDGDEGSARSFCGRGIKRWQGWLRVSLAYDKLIFQIGVLEGRSAKPEKRGPAQDGFQAVADFIVQHLPISRIAVKARGLTGDIQGRVSTQAESRGRSR